MRTVLVHLHQDWLLGALQHWQTDISDPSAITPSLQAGRDLRRVLPGIGKTMTLAQLARVALREQGWQLLSASERLPLLQETVSALPLEYLSGLLERQGTADVLLSLMGELFRADLEPATLQAVTASPRERDVGQVFTAWVKCCRERRVFDAVSAEYFAARYASPVSMPYLVHGFAHVDAAQAHWLDRLLADSSLVTLPFVPEGLGMERTRLSLQELEKREFSVLHQPASPSKRTGALAAQHYVLGKSECSPVHSQFEFADIESEVRACLRQVRTWLAEGIPAERITVLIGSEEVYLPTLADVAQEYDLPLISGQQIPLRATPLGSLLNAWIEAHEQEWRFSRTRRLLIHPLLHWERNLSLISRRLQRTAPHGLPVWGADVEWLAWPEITTWSQALRLIERLLVEGGVQTRAASHPALNTALAMLIEELSGWSGSDEEVETTHVLAELRHILKTRTVLALLSRNGVRVTNPLAALGRSFDCMWVLGLSDGLFPRRVTDHPLIDQSTRARWAQQGVFVPDLTVLASAQEDLFLGALAACEQELCISRPRRDLTDRDLPAGSYWRGLGGQLSAPTQLDWGSEAEKLLQEALAGRGLPGEVAFKAEVERGRAAGKSGPHRGQLQQGVAVSERTWSPSQLHSVGSCRYRWFAERLLKLEEQIDPDEVEDRCASGTLLHAGLEGALEGWQAGDPTEVLVNRAQAAYEAKERALLASGDLRPSPLWPVTRREQLEMLERAVQSPDFLRPGHHPVQLEAWREFTLPAGPYEYRLRGILDRVDETPEGLLVTDYKSNQYVSHVNRDGR